MKNQPKRLADTCVFARFKFRSGSLCIAALPVIAVSILFAQPPAAPIPPVPPPPALGQIVSPDINKLGLLDCAGPDGNSGVTAATPFTSCTQYSGFPITKPGQRTKLVALGKALFWDMRVGADGVQACATCHFHAGADSRTKNQLSPGLNRISATQFAINAAINPNQLTAAPDFTFDAPLVNGQLAALHFPRLSNPQAAASPQFGNNDVTSSQGVRKGSFISAGASSRQDNGNIDATDSSGFNLSSPALTARRVEPRNTPTTIMAGYNLRNFWDGRANMYFNGVNPFGMLDPAARVKVSASPDAAPVDQLVMLPFSSLASQAVGPPGSPFEMSLDGRTLSDIGHKLLTLNPDVPLDGQRVASNDSVLRDYANTGPATGLNKSYQAFISEIFQDKFWSGLNPNGGPLTLMEYNFGLFFGVAVQAYEATLAPDKTPLDPILAFMTPLLQAGTLPAAALANARSAATIPNSTLSQADRQLLVDALTVFLTPASNCFVCHGGAEFTGATISTLTGFGRPVAAPLAPPAVPEALALIERMFMGDGNQAVYDAGFYNIGVRPAGDDLSVFGRTPGNVPFSIGMLQQEILRGNPSVSAVAALLASGALKQPAAAIGFPNFSVDLNAVPMTALALGCAPPAANAVAAGQVKGNGCAPLGIAERLAIRGAFKTSTLRNAKFTGPYFHNGGRSNVTDVITNHYNVGGIFNLGFNPQNCAIKPNGTSATKGCLNGQVDFDAAILPLGLTPAQIDSIANLIEFGLTDDRVTREQGPFDHPQLCVPLGHNATTGATELAEVPEVGATGNTVDLQTFEQALDPTDTNHAHKLVGGSCTMSGNLPL